MAILLTSREVAAILGISMQAVAALRRRKVLLPVPWTGRGSGHLALYDAGDVHAYHNALRKAEESEGLDQYRALQEPHHQPRANCPTCGQPLVRQFSLSKLSQP